MFKPFLPWPVFYYSMGMTLCDLLLVQVIETPKWRICLMGFIGEIDISPMKIIQIIQLHIKHYKVWIAFRRQLK